MMLMALVSVFVMTGCADAPEDVLEKWSEAILAGDKAAADEFVTADAKDKENAFMIALVSHNKDEAAKWFDKLKAGEVVVDGDNAEVKVDGTKVRLKKVDGKWLIDEVELN